MSRPRELWYDYVRRVIRSYPALKREHDNLQSMVVTVRYNATGGNSGPSRTTELAAIRELPPEKQRYYTAVQHAIEKTQSVARGRREPRCQFLKLYHFKQTHTMEGAAAACHISYSTARRWNQEFMRLVARNLKLSDD